MELCLSLTQLSPIENVLGYLKNYVQTKMLKNLTELDQFVKQRFKEICTSEYCKKYATMPKRLDLVIEQKGFRILVVFG